MLLAAGQVVAAGTADEVLTAEIISEHYGAKVRVINDIHGPVVIPERH